MYEVFLDTIQYSVIPLLSCNNLSSGIWYWIELSNQVFISSQAKVNFRNSIKLTLIFASIASKSLNVPLSGFFRFKATECFVGRVPSLHYSTLLKNFVTQHSMKTSVTIWLKMMQFSSYCCIFSFWEVDANSTFNFIQIKMVFHISGRK